MPKRHSIALMVLIPCALLWSWAALVGRADSFEDVSRGKATDWIILGPLWAGIAYIAASAAFRTHPRRLPIAVGVAFGVWVVVALAANSWEDKKVEIRMRHLRQGQVEDGGAISNLMPNHALQRTAAGRRGFIRRALGPPSLSFIR